MSSNTSFAANGARKAAILLSLLGEDEAGPILRSLPVGDLQRLTDEVASLPPVPVEITLQVLEEYRQMMAAQDYLAVGGKEMAARLLVSALGEQGSKAMVQKLDRDEEEGAFRLDVVRKSEPHQLARFLAGEHAQTAALILGHLDARQASSVLMNLDPDKRTDCVRRLANMGNFSPRAAAKASQVLERRFKGTSDQTRQDDAGIKRLAEMMNRMDPASMAEILQSVENEEPQLAIRIRDTMFTFENFLEVPEQYLRELVNTIDKKTLALALKGASEDIRAHFYRTMSSRAVEMLKEDAEMMGPVRGKEVARAQTEIVAVARKLEAEGKIVLKSEGEDEYVL